MTPSSPPSVLTLWPPRHRSTRREPSSLVAIALAAAVCLASPAAAAQEPSPERDPKPEAPAMPRHHLEVMTSAALSLISCACDGYDPGAPFGLGARVGYRYRFKRWLELGVAPSFHLYPQKSPGLDRYLQSVQVSVPLLVHFRLELEGGHGLTLGVGGGVQHFSGTVGRPPDTIGWQLTTYLLQASLGASVQVTPRWSVVFDASLQTGGGTNRVDDPTRYPAGYIANSSAFYLGAQAGLGARYSL